MSRKLKMVVVHHEKDEHGEHHKHHHKEYEHYKHHDKEDDYKLPHESEANALMSEDFEEYVKKHGYHFTEELAEHLSKMMENTNGQMHTWTAQQVKKAMESLGLMPLGKTKSEATLGDVTYLANMYYADLYPDPLKDEASCLKAAYKIAVDPDGYKGMVFCRWTADAIGLATKVDWKKFV